MSLPTAEAIASATTIYNDMRAKARPLVDRFEARYAAWKQTWDKPSERVETFAPLTGMGVKILPLVVYKLCDDTDVMVVELYNAIEKNTDYVSPSPAVIVAKNHQRHQDFVERSVGWEKFKIENPFSSNSVTYTTCDEYVDLMDLGIGIVPYAMLAYYDDYGGWWDELLCELISGHKSGAVVMFRRDIHRRWIDWFENKEGEAEAPYKLDDEAARFARWVREGIRDDAHADPS